MAHSRGDPLYLKDREYGVEISRYYADLDYAAHHNWDKMLEAYHAA